jgi:hypothetical protein
MIRTLLRLFAPRPDPWQFVSQDCLRSALRAECTRGWEDAPTWRWPRKGSMGYWDKQPTRLRAVRKAP